MDYKGYKLLDRITLVCREEASREDSCGANGGNNYYQAYLVDPTSKSQLASARQWAKWIEYAPWVRDENGNWVRDDYEIIHEPVEFEFENSGFTLELLDCAGGSSKGGKLSFWNCLVKKDDKTFKIGIGTGAAAAPKAAGSGDAKEIASPLPGTVLRISVKAGDVVAAGDELMVLEAMKMETPVKAENAGTIVDVLVNEKDVVTAGQALLSIEESK